MEVKDARGLLCPEPVLITKKEIERLGKGTFQVLVDTVAARDNITRLAKSKKWEISAQPRGDEFLLTLKK
ncbi:MAG: sulfurtransferase TusA family protein [Desulfotomaculaceae bacterium]|nr:sulfurtransferase TusA family protein [Desulfotomaculaceae bacterium]MDD4766841.1 sulfurtransferase TusA family protein [Desulfotomaculaceae bacterium]